eukprot:Phypoly_transcript_11982.p1 GENE.Phypoly_transcript_11982~~Phypoly_transcript_11982.p1  ORF type:complete len:353 (+),score=79.36 Phypoly_transcript_11982:69-1127(+)
MQVARFLSRSALRGPSRSAMCARMYTTVAPATTAPTKIPIQLIQDLRNRTGAGISDCKKALELNQSDIASATAWLREKGKLTATKLSNRVAGEGVIALATNGGNGVIVEVNSETDFVARASSFRSLAHKIVDHTVSAVSIIPKDGIQPIEIETLKKLHVEVESDEKGLPPIRVPVEEAITRTVTKTKENVKLRRAYGISVEKGIVGGYIHGGEGDSKAGRIGALVTLLPSSHDNADRNTLTTLATQIAMHIVGLNPKCVDNDSPALTQALEAARAAPNARTNITAADIAEDVVLLEQKFFAGNGETVREALARAGTPGAPVRVHSFLRLAVGEGIEKVQSDFADEVMGMMKK